MDLSRINAIVDKGYKELEKRDKIIERHIKEDKSRRKLKLDMYDTWVYKSHFSERDGNET
jgi:hypothetical protein